MGLFGTDGVRGVANADLTAELAMALGAAAARSLGRAHAVAVVGRDPRASGEMLEAAVVAGIAAEGVDVLRVGVLPTPAVAYLTGAYGAAFGVMISASHNPMPDNGIKILAPAATNSMTTPRRPSRRSSRRFRSVRPAGESAGCVTLWTRSIGTCITSRMPALTR